MDDFWDNSLREALVRWVRGREWRGEWEQTTQARDERKQHW
jgi:hypothetical protein